MDNVIHQIFMQHSVILKHLVADKVHEYKYRVPEEGEENAAISDEVWDKEKDILRLRKLSE